MEFCVHLKQLNQQLERPTEPQAKAERLSLSMQTAKRKLDAKALESISAGSCNVKANVLDLCFTLLLLPSLKFADADDDGALKRP